MQAKDETVNKLKSIWPEPSIKGAGQKYCIECGAVAAHQHHVIPESMGGKATVPLCEHHHSMVHAADLTVNALREAAKAKRAAAGYRVSRLSFGWDEDADGKLIENPTEQAGLALIRQRRDAGATYKNIADELNGTGYKTKQGKTWDAKTVWNIVKRGYQPNRYLLRDRANEKV